MSDEPKTIKSPKGKLTFAQIDGPDDVWIWGIVAGYRDAQDYDWLVMGFHENAVPPRNVAATTLAALEQQLFKEGDKPEEAPSNLEVAQPDFEELERLATRLLGAVKTKAQGVSEVKIVADYILSMLSATKE
jgi:hypothetical protein